MKDASFSLLWPPNALSSSTRQSTHLSTAAWHDLDLSKIVAAFTIKPDQQAVVRQILAEPLQDLPIICYRQDVLEDLLNNPRLVEQLETLFPVIDALGRFGYPNGQDMNTLHEITWRLGELQSIVDCIQGLGQVFRDLNQDLKSQGLRALRAEILDEQHDPTFQNLAGELPELLARVRTCASVTIGVNLDQYLRPVQATLLAVNEEPFTSPSMLNRLFGKTDSPMEGITPLQSLPKKEVEGHYALPISSDLGWAAEPMMVPLFRDLAAVIEKTTQPIVKRLRHYTQVKGRMFTGLRQDLIFYLGAVRWIQRLQTQGLPLCRPELAPVEERVCQVEQAYNLLLALHLQTAQDGQDLAGAITLNDIHIGAEGRILILTGPNQGGKTTYMVGVALVQVLAQAGLFVPGVRARLSPVDNIYTHFPVEERPVAETGRLGEEAARLAEIFQHVSRHSLVLLNETFTSTSAGESLYLAQDIMRILREVGGRTIYSTHMHELAERVDELNQAISGDSRIISLVSSPLVTRISAPEKIHRSYRVEARPPLGRSYALEIAERYGISFEQLEKKLTQRGAINSHSNL